MLVLSAPVTLKMSTRCDMSKPLVLRPDYIGGGTVKTHLRRNDTFLIFNLMPMVCSTDHFYLFQKFILVVLCVPRSDIYRIINGYDDCGNVCGRSNSQTIDLLCSGQNMIAKKYLMLTVVNSVTDPLRQCVSDCDADNGYKLFFNRCIKFDPLRRERATQSYLDEIWQDVESFRMEILWLCLLAFICSVLLLILVWCVPHLLIWSLIFGTVAVCLAGTIWLWIKWHLEEGAKKWLYCAIGSSIASVLVCLLLVAVWKKLTLMIQLLHETGEALKSMIFLIGIPVLTIFTIIVSISLSVYVGLLIESTGLAALVGQSVHYVSGYIASISRWYNILALVWFYHFLLGCQHMVIAGAVTQWYFTREKDHLRNAEGRSFTMLLRYHLGTVALGSFLMAILLLIRWLFNILRLITKTSKTNKITCCCQKCCVCCMGCLQSLLEPIARNAYIVTALHGEPFCKAGKRVVQIFTANGQMFAVESVGTIIFVLAQLLILILVGFVGMELMHDQQEFYHPYVLLAVVLAIVYLQTHCFMLVYKISIGGTFLCFYQDIEINDGVDRPYFMSSGLQKFVQGSSKPIRQDGSALESANTSQQPPQA